MLELTYDNMVMVMVMVIYSALVRSHQSTSAGVAFAGRARSSASRVSGYNTRTIIMIIIDSISKLRRLP